MKKRNILPLLIILAGMYMLGKGLTQYFDSMIQSNKAVNEGRELVQLEDKPMKAGGRLTPEQGETAGLLIIPKINAELAIVEGTDPDDLDKGVGHYRNSFYPGENGQIVLSGHRDTVFRKLGQLELNDILEVRMAYGTFQYEITNTKIVGANDTSIITLQDTEEELILTTCYPFGFIGDAPDRYIIYAKKID